MKQKKKKKGGGRASFKARKLGRRGEVGEDETLEGGRAQEG